MLSWQIFLFSFLEFMVTGVLATFFFFQTNLDACVLIHYNKNVGFLCMMYLQSCEENQE